MTAYLDLTGTSGVNASTPYDADFDITGDLDIRFIAEPDDATPASNQVVASRHVDATGECWQIVMQTTGACSFGWVPALSGTYRFQNSSAGFFTAGKGVYRVTLQPNVAGDSVVTFYTGDAVDGTWTQFGQDTDIGAGDTIQTASSDLYVSGRNNGTSLPFAGNVYQFQLRDGIDGTIVANPIFAAAYPGDTSLTDSTGKLWTWSSASVGDDGEDLSGGITGLQAAAQAHWGKDLNGALRDASGLTKDANGISQTFWGRDLYQARRQALALLEGGGGQATPPP